MKIQALITGDVVRSNRISKKDELAKAVKDALSQLEQKGLADKGKSTANGASYSWVSSNPNDALKGILIFRALLRLATPDSEKNLWDSRFSIGLGDDSSDSGSSSYRSSKGLDKMKSKDRITLSSGNKDLDGEFNIAFALAESIISRWSKGSSEVSKGFWHNGQNQYEIAESLRISQPAVSKRFFSAGIDVLDRLVKRFESRISKNS